MPFEQTNDGLQIQPLSEILNELRASFQDPTIGFGAGAQVAPNSAFGQIIGIWSEREALIQQLALQIQSQFDTREAQGVELDVLAEMTATFRQPADQSISSSGQCQGVFGTIVSDGSRIRNAGTSELWEIFNGPYTIGAFGAVNCEIRALDTGEVTFLTATVWEIVDNIAGWNDFITVADIDPEDIGRNIESDEELRLRRLIELFAGGNDLSAIKAVVSRVRGVEEVAVYENRDCTNTSPDGIPPGAMEVVVEGGDDTEIAEAIYSRKPPGTETFGAVNISISDEEGNPINIGFTRVTDVDVWLNFVINVGNAEVALPDNAQTLLEEAVLEFANENTAVGQDVLPETFCQPIWEVLKDPETGKYAAETLTLEAGLTPVTFGLPIPIGIRDRADYDSARITVTIA